jgi:hypothetical protein
MNKRSLPLVAVPRLIVRMVYLEYHQGSGLEQTRPEKLLPSAGDPDWTLLGKTVNQPGSKWKFWPMSDLFSPDSLGQSPAWEGRAAQGVCRFPGLDSTEAERLSGESRLPLLLSFSVCILQRSVQRQEAARKHIPRTVELDAACSRGS